MRRPIIRRLPVHSLVIAFCLGLAGGLIAPVLPGPGLVGPVFLGHRAWASQTLRISQKGRAFAVKTAAIVHGDTLQFTNEDDFLHQIYVKSNGMNFDSNEQSPGETISVRFPDAGTFEVRCHIHPTMLLVVTVK